MPNTRPFVVRPSSIHGSGVFATRTLKANTSLGIYEGRRLSADECDAKEWDGQLTYLFGLSDGTSIDGSDGGNDLRHLNHSCSPNCEAIETWDEDGSVWLEIVLTRKVPANEELCIDYALIVDGSHTPHDYPCACTSTKCRGTMLEVA